MQHAGDAVLVADEKTAHQEKNAYDREAEPHLPRAIGFCEKQINDPQQRGDDENKEDHGRRQLHKGQQLLCLTRQGDIHRRKGIAPHQQFHIIRKAENRRRKTEQRHGDPCLFNKEINQAKNQINDDQAKPYFHHGRFRPFGKQTEYALVTVVSESRAVHQFHIQPAKKGVQTQTDSGNPLDRFFIKELLCFSFTVFRLHFTVPSLIPKSFRRLNAVNHHPFILPSGKSASARDCDR